MRHVLGIAILLSVAVAWAKPAAIGADAENPKRETAGKVTDVAGDKVTIGLNPGVALHEGDRVEIFVEIPGVGDAQVATATIASVTKDSATAKVQEATGNIELGQRVRPTAGGKVPPAWIRKTRPIGEGLETQPKLPPPPERTLFCYTDRDGRKGCFARLGGPDWIEVTGVRDCFFFQESSRNGQWIELVDRSRGEEGIGVRLHGDKSEWKCKEHTQGDWAPLWAGAWISASSPERIWAVFSYTDSDGRRGCFIHPKGEDWIELTGTHDKWTFKEIGRGGGSIELFDESRGGIGVRFFGDRSEWKSERTDGNWAPLWRGAWIVGSAAEPGVRVDAGAATSGRLPPPVLPGPKTAPE